MTARTRRDTNIWQSRDGKFLQAKVFICLLAAILVGVFVTADASEAGESTSRKYRRADVDGDVLTNLVLWKGVVSKVQCATLCEEPECSGFSMDVPKQECQLFTGQILGVATEPDYSIYVKVPECPIELGFHLVTVDSSKFCIGVYALLATAQEAYDACKSMDSTLTILDTQLAYDALGQAAEEKILFTNYLYVGMFYDLHRHEFLLDETGEPPAEGPFWNDYQPSNPMSENCVVFHKWDRRLHDGFCNVPDGFSCQKFV